MSVRGSRATQVAGTTLLALATAVLVWNAARFLRYACEMVSYPYELDYTEGPILNNTIRFIAGGALYHDIASGPFTTANYPPLYHVVTALVDTAVHDALFAGRVVSLASTLLIAALIGGVVWHAVDRRSPLVARGLASLSGALLFLAVLYVYIWAPLMRVDLLALLFSLIGVAIFSRGFDRGARVYWSIVPFVLAVFTRQNAVAAPAACLLVALATRPAVAGALAGGLIVVGGGVLAGLLWWSHGAMYFHLVTATVTQIHWHHAVPFLSDLGGRYAIDLAVATVTAYAFVRDGVRGERNGEPVSWIRPVLGAYLFTAMLMTLTVAKVGAHINYLLEAMMVVCACFCAGIGEVFAPLKAGIGERVAMVVLPALLLWRAVAIVHGPEQDWADSATTLPRNEAAQLVSLLRATDGAVLSQDMTAMILARKSIEFQPFEMTQLALRKAWDQTPLLTQLAHARFQLIVLEFDLETEAQLGADLFTPEMLAAMREHYARSGRIGRYVTYRPRGPDSSLVTSP